VQDRKRKKEEEEAWEARRDERISSWRTFKTAGSSSPVPVAKPKAKDPLAFLPDLEPPKKKKKSKLNVLG
jgi:DnaJ family protein C protein 8